MRGHGLKAFTLEPVSGHGFALHCHACNTVAAQVGWDVRPNTIPALVREHVRSTAR